MGLPDAAARRRRGTCMKSVLPLLLLAAALVPVAARQQQPTFRSGARTVAVYATVTDKGGRLVPDLARDVFEVRDNGKPQPITVFSNDVQPITVVIMLDRSTSMRGNLRLVERDAEEFVRRLGPGDKARISTSTERVVVRPEDFTSDQAVLLGILQSDLPSSGPTPLWNAMDDA